MKKTIEAIRRAAAAVGRVLDGGDNLLRRGLDGGLGKVPVAVLWALATGLFYYVAHRCKYDLVDTFPPRDAAFIQMWLAIAYAALFALTLAGLYVLLYKRQATPALFLMMTVVWMATLVARISLLDYVSGDYTDFLGDWIWVMQDRGFAGSIVGNVGDYLPPYMYIIYVISRVSERVPDMYLLKLVSIAFDYLLAYFVMKLVSLKYKGLLTQLSFMMLALWAPTALLNGAYWGQCDAIYVSFALGGLYFALADKPYRSLLLFGISFAFKLQAIFLLPILLVLYGMRKIRLKHVLVFPAVYLLLMSPALIAGKSLFGKDVGSIMDIYAMQISNYPQLVIGAPSVWQLLPEKVFSYRIFYNVGLYLSMGAAITFCGFLYIEGRRLTTEIVIAASQTLVMAMPLLLPCMHSRYFFLADLLSIAYLAFFPKRWYLPATVLTASLVAYTRSLMGAVIYDGLPFMAFSLALIVLTALSALHTAQMVRQAAQPALASAEEAAYNKQPASNKRIEERVAKQA